uniref:NADH-ubiquinone oxidoreductase chain 4 n=1 Tax=Strombidium sp. TaxID=181122 RepID=A0A7T0M4P2_9SPIT|nr:NADH dehydrogenase subunit 4 [Strombidium sp.]
MRNFLIMLWYGFIYYFLINIIIMLFFFLYFKVQLFSSLNYQKILLNYNSIFIYTIMYFFLLILILINSLHFEFINIILLFSHSIQLIFNFNNTIFFYNEDVFFTILQVYYYPYIYIFILITSLSIIYTLSYSIIEFKDFMYYLVLIFLAGTVLFFTNSIIIFFMAYETLLIPSFFILYKYAKTKRSVEAAYLMFFWTQFGALFLIILFMYMFLITNSSSFTVIELTYFSTFELNFFFIFLIIGFGVKLPIWPFYGWLPKAHVEASTNFSIFLSGVLVKFAFFGLLKILITLSIEPTFTFVYPFLFIGLVDSVFKLFYQIDLKKLVAYSTVVEMHWLTICIISGQSNLLLSGYCMLISHALLSTNSFLLVDAIARRFKTRLITEISGINFLTPKLFLIILLNLLIFLGFPGTLFFIAEFLFFTFFIDLFPIMAMVSMLLLYLIAPTFFFKSWMNVIFGYSNFLHKKLTIDLTLSEFIIFSFVIILMMWFSIIWQSFLF